MTAWVSAAQPLAGEGMELQSIAAVVVGGVALAGGSGNMLQAFYGVLVLGLVVQCAEHGRRFVLSCRCWSLASSSCSPSIVDRLRTRTAT